MNCKGFTLLETLVVLVIVGLSSTLIYQTSGFFFQIYSRIGSHIGEDSRAELAHNWLQESIMHLSPNYRKPSGGFNGTPSILQFESLSGLESLAGVPVEQHWEIVSTGIGSKLVYLSSIGNEWVVKEDEQIQYEFRYQDTSGAWLMEWSEKNSDGLPRMIMLGSASDDTTALYFSINADWNPPPVFPGDN